jgi:hypothetical protein
MNETLVLSPQALAQLLTKLKAIGPIRCGHGATLDSLFGMPIIVSEHLPPGEILMVSDPARALALPDVMSCAMPELSVAQTRLLAPHCDAFMYDQSNGLRYALVLRQQDRELGLLPINYEHPTIHGHPGNFIHKTMRSGRIDKSELSAFLRTYPGPDEWWGIDQVS